MNTAALAACTMHPAIPSWSAKQAVTPPLFEGWKPVLKHKAKEIRDRRKVIYVGSNSGSGEGMLKYYFSSVQTVSSSTLFCYRHVSRGHVLLFREVLDANLTAFHPPQQDSTALTLAFYNTLGDLVVEKEFPLELRSEEPLRAGTVMAEVAEFYKAVMPQRWSCNSKVLLRRPGAPLLSPPMKANTVIYQPFVRPSKRMRMRERGEDA